MLIRTWGENPKSFGQEFTPTPPSGKCQNKKVTFKNWAPDIQRGPARKLNCSSPAGFIFCQYSLLARARTHGLVCISRPCNRFYFKFGEKNISRPCIRFDITFGEIKACSTIQMISITNPDLNTNLCPGHLLL